ncbi:MAG: hypothetical protein ACHQ4H_06330 [Ktedonobacterales bacterium]
MMDSTIATREAPEMRRAKRLRLLAALAPLALVAVLLLLTARAEYFKHGYANLLGFAALGSNYSQHIGINGGWVSAVGYDGQFYYYLALRPSLIVTCAHDTASCPLDSQGLVRVERILYPMTARLLALGQPGLIPFALLLVNFLAILITAALVGQLCAEAGASRWLGAAAALYCGETLAFARDLADPYAAMWLVLAVWLARKDRWLWAAAAGAAAILTREQLIFLVPLLAIPLLAQRRWRTLALTAAILVVPVAAWQIALHSLYGAWPLLRGDSQAATLDAIPFAGLWAQRAAGDFRLEVLAVAIPLIATAIVAALALRRDGPRGVLRDPLAAMVLLYTLLVSLNAARQWVDLWAPSRLAIDATLLAVIVAARLPTWVRVPYGLLLAATSVALLLGNVPYIFGAHPHVLR